MSAFDSTKLRLAELLRDITAGKIQLPDFQRGWVWDDEHIRSLLVSIARAFPVGAIMLLETGGETRFKVRPVEGLDPTAISPQLAERLILDGQQRLTSLTQVLMLNKPVQTRDEKKRPVERYYYIDIDKALEGAEKLEDAVFAVDEEKVSRANFGRDISLDLRTQEKEYEQLCFPCNQILNSDQWEQGLHTHDAANFGRYMTFRRDVLDQFRNYDIPLIELKKENKKEAVCLVFEKVNTGGVPLSVFELMTATYAADGVNLRDEWFGNRSESIEGIKPHLSRQRLLRDVEPTDFLQGLSLLYTLERRKADLEAGRTGKQVTGVSAKREAVLSLPLDAYKRWKDQLVAGFWTTAKFLRKESFFVNGDLPYRTQLVPLATVLALLGDHWLEPLILEKLSRWFWCGVLGELYGGAVESRFALDVQELLEWINGSSTEPSTIRDASFQPQRLDTLRSRNSAAYKGINVLIQRNGAKDFFWKSTIRELDETDWEERKLDIHHIFPRDWCEKRAIPSRRFDSILNKTPISYKANRMIGGKAPSSYLHQLQHHPQVRLDDAGMDAILQTHFIAPALLRADEFDAFIEARRSSLIEQISAAMGKAVRSTGEVVPEDDVEDEESYVSESPATGDDLELDNDDRKKLKRAYWQALQKTLAVSIPYLKIPDDATRDWVQFSVWRSNMWIAVVLELHDQKVYIEIGFREKRRAEFEQLRGLAASFEKELAAPLEWIEGSTSYMITYVPDARVIDQSDWPRQHEWLCEKLRICCRVLPQVTGKSVARLEANPELRLEFWKSFIKYLAKSDSRIEIFTPRAKVSVELPIAPGCTLLLMFKEKENYLYAGVAFDEEAGHATYARSITETDRIQQEIGEKLAWEDEGQQKYIGVYRREELDDSTNWPDYHQWLKSEGERFLEFFKGYAAAPTPLIHAE